MNQIIQLLLSLGFKYHKKESETTLIKTYVFNWNGVRHWAQVYNPDIQDVLAPSIRLYSFREGTGDDEPIVDTGIVGMPTNIFIMDFVDKQKELM